MFGSLCPRSQLTSGFFFSFFSAISGLNQMLVMALKMVLKLAIMAWLVTSVAKPCCGRKVFNVRKYGAISDGKTDNKGAFSAAWAAACKHAGPAWLKIPRGTFLVGPIVFAGPCFSNSSPIFEIRGRLQAPSSANSISTVGWIEFRGLNNLVVDGGGIVDGQGADSWNPTKRKQRKSKNLPPMSLRFIKNSNTIIANLTLRDSKGYHMSIQRSNFMTVRNLKISAPGYSPNTDGIHISDTNNVDIAGLTIGTGDDCISVGQGNTNVSISNIVCNPGHGISVGSLGKYTDDKDVVGVKVKNCTISNAINGIHIKTWPGSNSGRASDLSFEDIRVNNVSNPIIINQEYCAGNKCSSKPSLFQVKNVLFKGISGTSRHDDAVSLICSPAVPCENVQFHDISLRSIHGSAKGITSRCSNVKGLNTRPLKHDACF